MTEKNSWQKSTALKMGPNKPIIFEQHIEDIDGHPNLLTVARIERAGNQGQSKTFFFRLKKKPDNELIKQLERNYWASIDELNDIAGNITAYIKLKTKRSNEALEREIFWQVLLDVAEGSHEALEDYDTQSLRVENSAKNKAEIMEVIDETWQRIVKKSRETKTPLEDVVSDDGLQEAILETLPELEKKAKDLQGYAADFGKGSYQYPNEDLLPINQEAIEAAAELRTQIDNMRIALADAWWHAAESIPDVMKARLDHVRRNANPPQKTNADNDKPEGFSLKDYYAAMEKKGINNSFIFRSHDRASASRKKALDALSEYTKKIGSNDSPENKENQRVIEKMLGDISKAIDIISEPRGLLQEIESSRAKDAKGK